MDLRELRKTATIFALAAGVTTGGVIGGGVLYHQYRTPEAQVQTATVQMNANNRTITDAQVVKVGADRSIVMLAHTWVG